jgi:hypothetical protein
MNKVYIKQRLIDGLYNPKTTDNMDFNKATIPEDTKLNDVVGLVEKIIVALEPAYYRQAENGVEPIRVR